MKVFEANITYQVSEYLNSFLKNIISFETANQKMNDAFGIIHLFDSNDELEILKETISISNNIVSEPDRACLLYTSDAADERSSVDLGGRRIIKKKTHTHIHTTKQSSKKNT